VIGHVLSYEQSGRPEVSYWLGRDFWGRGLATRALSDFLARVNQKRPIYARVAKDNLRSLRVLEKCGFRITGEDKGFANARGEEVEEWILERAET
jgi:RimJ/RimL family protein N-acetyltransferase